MKYDQQRELNQEALDNPQPGDYWHEMFSPYFVVVDVKDLKYTVLSCMGGPDSWNRKDELNAMIDMGDNWRFDYSKSMVVDRAWIEKAVKYGNIEGFVADVVRTEKTERIVQEWRNWVQKELRKKMEEAEAAWHEFTGWKYIKDGIPV